MLNKEKHRVLIFKILKDIFNSDIWPFLAFKWWTACYFLYWLDRFSTDLDFDLIDTTKNIDEKLIEILRKYWKIKKGNKIILSYWEDDINIKIDINRNVWENNNYEFVDFYWTTIKIQDKPTIFANKLVAFIQRHTNRDIYDMYFFFNKMFKINEKLIVERTWNTKKELFLKIKNKLSKLPKNYKILDWLWEVLDNKQKNFVKNDLIKELLGIIDFNIRL